VQVAILRGHPVFQVKGTHVFANEEMHVDDERCPHLPHVSCPYKHIIRMSMRVPWWPAEFCALWGENAYTRPISYWQLFMPTLEKNSFAQALLCEDTHWAGLIRVLLSNAFQ